MDREPGVNETFALSADSDEIADSDRLQGLLVAHPRVRNVTRVSLRYGKYKGWIYSGKETWSVDKIELTTCTGQIYSYCGANTRLEDGLPLVVHVAPFNCSLPAQRPATGPTAGKISLQPPPPSPTNGQQQPPQTTSTPSSGGEAPVASASSRVARFVWGALGRRNSSGSKSAALDDKLNSIASSTSTSTRAAKSSAMSKAEARQKGRAMLSKARLRRQGRAMRLITTTTEMPPTTSARPQRWIVWRVLAFGRP